MPFPGLPDVAEFPGLPSHGDPLQNSCSFPAGDGISQREMGTPEPDDQLIARICAGRLESFEILVDRHLSAIRAFTAYHAPTSESVDEITKATFAFALDNFHFFKAGTDLRGWLRAIAVKLIAMEFDRARANAGSRFELKRLDRSERRKVDPYSPTKEEFLGASLKGLPELLQKVAKLHYQEHKSAEEISAALGRNVAAVRLALFRLRQELRRRVKTKLAESQHAK